MVLSIVAGPKFIEFLRRNEMGQPIREEGPEHHVIKQGTPVMGGLAAGTGVIALFTFTAINVIAYIRSGPPGHRFDTKLDLAIIGAALIGGTIGFLWYNAFPAEVFMGDTGSMAIGGALAAFAIFTKTEFLLLLIGGIFLIEALSVMIQVFTFKYLGRRVFLMAPIHYHFEMKAWSEP